MNYFILVNNQQQGPYTVDQLRTMELTQETLVWAEGMKQWTPAWQVEELKNVLFNQQGSNGTATPPPPPVSDDGNPTAQPEPPVEPNTATQPGQPAQPKKKGHKALYYVLAAVVILLFIFALTNPGQAEHRQAIIDKVDTASEQAYNISDPMVRSIVQSISGMGNGMIKGVITQLIDEDLEYHNYILFSTTTLHSDMLRHDIRCSTGFLGHVNAISISNILPDIVMQQMGGSGDDDSHSSVESVEQHSEQGPDGEQTTVTTKTVKKDGVTVDSLTKRVTSRIADEVARKVKSEVKQQADSATSSDVNGIVDQVLNFLKNLL